MHEDDILVCEDGYAIKVLKDKDDIFVLEFKDALSFCKTAYEIGNRHQPLMIEEFKIIVLDDISIADIIKDFMQREIKCEKKGYFKPMKHTHSH